ncbi:hypothetical protein MSG28_000835 [Choristoneura fumiferana]|uniref:Uncharacterized protein n=1 Tax=Choristoneura fumiferana TaxID=7141 RepID=A0ACC0K2I4_CHOFU|nr:hypothetical protein MSG28_000835 [Choristoneura fumiferana]
MGDRNNPIKFGPEWLRNLSRERNASNLGSMNQSAALSTGGAARPASPPPGNPLNASASTPQKIHLANLRYGREEMLALYDRTVEAPTELKSIDQLYQPRGKPPFALHNSFEDDMRENLRSGGPPIGGVMTPERFGMGRGLGRGLAVADNRGRPRMPFVRQPSLGRGNAYHPRIPGYGPATDEEAAAVPRSWGNTNGGPSTNRNTNEQAEWATNKTFRSKRPTSNTNWRSPQTREDGEEWRLSDPGRPRTGPQEKWERDWGDRPNQEKPPSWNTNRRTWGGDSQNEENLPEWAMDNAEACAGTFDSSGAFHGYSNDDSNLPKNQEASYSLTRSHTHGSFARLKSVEDGSEEWWASAKAKKLSPKKFDASDIKFKKQMSMPAGDETGNNSSSKPSGTSKEENNASHEAQENLVTSPDSSDSGQAENTFNKNNAYRSNFSENKTFDALMRSDINMDEASDERGNFQSVTIKPNNSLRQKHQNIVASAADKPSPQVRKGGNLKGLQEASAGQTVEQEFSKLSAKSPEDKIVEDIFEITLDDKDILSKLPSVIGLPLNTSNAGISPSKVTMVNSVPHGSSPAMQKRVSSPNPASHGNVMHTPSSSMVGPGMHPNSMHTLGHATGTKAPGMQPPGVHSHHLQTVTMHSGMPAHGLPSPSAQVSGMQSPGIQNSTLQTLGLQPSGSKNAGMPSPGMHTQGLLASGMQTHGMQMPGIQAPGMQASMQVGLQSLGMQSSGMQPGMQNTSNQTPALQNIGISNAALNSAMRLQGPRLIEQGHSNNSMGIPLQRMSPPALLLNPGMANSPMGASGMHPGSPAMTGFPNSSPMQGMTNTNNSIFGLGQNPNNTQMPPPNDIQMPNHGQSNMFPLHGLQQHSGSQGPFSSLYGNMMRQSPPQNNPSSQTLADHWYYEDPKDMAGFPISGFGMHNQGSHDSVMNSQSGLGLDVDSLWSQTSTSPELMWMQQSMNARNDMRVNNLPMIFWDQQNYHFRVITILKVEGVTFYIIIYSLEARTDIQAHGCCALYTPPTHQTERASTAFNMMESWKREWAANEPKCANQNKPHSDCLVSRFQEGLVPVEQNENGMWPKPSIYAQMWVERVTSMRVWSPSAGHRAHHRPLPTH